MRTSLVLLDSSIYGRLGGSGFTVEFHLRLIEDDTLLHSEIDGAKEHWHL